MKWKFTLALLLCMPLHAVYAQIQSLNSGVKTAWVVVPQGVKPDGQNVTIMPGHTVTIDSAAHTKNLVIEQSGTLNASANAAKDKLKTLLTGGADSVNIVNKGTFGSATPGNDGIALVIAPNSKNVFITGNGSNAIGSLTQSGNANLLLYINSNMTLKGKGLALSASDTSGDDKSTAVFVISKDKTVQLAGSESLLHGYSPKGNYTYLIEGTLDLANSTVNQNINSGNGLVTFNVNGKLKLGSSLTAANGSNGQVAFNVNDGLVDATKTNTLTLGNGYFATSGKGALMRYVANSSTNFPVGVNGALNPNTIILTNKNGGGYYRVSVKNAVDGDLSEDNKVLDRQWTITPDSGATNSELNVSALWTLTEENNNADNSAISIARWDNGSWTNVTSSVGGQGSLITPFVATTASQGTQPGIFTLARTGLSFSLYPNPSVSQVTIQHVQANAGAMIKIVSLYGKTVYEGSVNQGDKNTVVNVAKLDKGMYVVRFENVNKTYTAKLLKAE